MLRFRTTGEYLGAVTLIHPANPAVIAKSPHGLCVDAEQRVWAICYQPSEDGKYYAMRIDPTLGAAGQVVEAVDLGAFPEGAGPYNYSDMSGFVTLAATQPAGFWNFVKDSGVPRTRWTALTVEAERNAGDCVIEVRAADHLAALPSWPFHRLDGWTGFPPLAGLGLQGRYLEVRVTLLREFGAANGPVLNGLCVAYGAPGSELNITQHPRSVTVAPGGTAEFSVSAAGTGFAYKWYKEATPVATGTGPVLAVANAQAEQAGAYWARVSDATGGLLDSARARLHVDSSPGEGIRPNAYANNWTPRSGEAVEFTATMYGASPSPAPVFYQWRRNGMPIPGAFGLCSVSGNQDYSAQAYTIPAVTCADTAEYSVVFANAFWQVASWEYAQPRLSVLDQQYQPLPLVTVSPPSPVVIPDRYSPPTLTVTACFDVVCAQWYRADSSVGLVPIPGATGMQYTLPSPVPCWEIRVVVFDSGGVARESAPVEITGDCQP